MIDTFTIGTKVTWTDGIGQTRTGVVEGHIITEGRWAGRTPVRDDRTGLLRHPRNISAA